MATQKHRQVHHLSRDAGADPNGWVESITGLTADQPATDLLNNGATASRKQAATVSPFCVPDSDASLLQVVASAMCNDECSHCQVHAQVQPAVASDESSSSLSPQEELELRLEHALDALKVDVRMCA